MALRWYMALFSVAATAAKFDLILYGADGCVGHFAAAHLAQQSNLTWAVAGRNESKLRALVSQLGDVKSMPEVVVGALDNSSDPKTWLVDTKAVITAAGPFSLHGGEVLLKAAVELGVHYADTSDEFYWQRWMIDRYDQLAQKSGSKVIFSTGFCVLAGDLGSQLALGAISNHASNSDEPVALDAWLEGYNGGVSAGVIHTAEAMKKAQFPKEWETDPYVLAPNASSELRKDTKVEGMRYPSWVSGEGLVVSNIFGPYDARLLRRSFVHLNQPVTLRVGATSGLYPKWAAFLAEHPGSWSKLTQCPTESVYKDGSWSYRFHATSGSHSSHILLSGHGDPGYRFTALGLAETGLCLAGKVSKCLKQGAPGGVYPPMAALDPEGLKSRLESIDLLKVETMVNSEVIV